MIKAKALASVVLIVLLIAASAPPVWGEVITVDNFSFEEPDEGKIKGWDGEGVDGTPAVDIPGWTSDSTPADSGVETDYTPTDGIYTAFVMGDDPSVYNLTSRIIGAGEVYDLVFDARSTWAASTILATLYYDDSGSRVVGASQQFTLTGSMVEYSLTFAASSVPASVGKNIGIELDNDAGGWLGIDNVRLSIPDNPVLIYPVSVENQPWDLTLEWLPPPTFIPPGYNIYLDPNENKVSTRDPSVKINVALDPDPNYDVTGLVHGERYYWLVEARQDPVTTPPTDPNWVLSEVATFTTLPDTPVITKHPVGQTVPTTTEVTLTVEADNATGYQWYKDGTMLLGKTTPTLIIASMALGSEGNYYCNVSNAATPAGIDSDPARLMVQRRVALWTFEDTINSVVVTDENAFTGIYRDPNDSASAGAQYSDAVSSPGGGKALVLPGDTTESVGGDFGEFVEASDPNFFDFYPLGVTASAWVTQVDQGNGWRCIVSKEQRAVSPWIGWVLNTAGGPYGGFTIRQATGAGSSEPDITGVNEDLGNNWHLVTGTYDGETVSLYVDGERKNTATSSVVPDPIPGEPLRIGVETFEGLSPWKGMIDNLEIYNYALSRVDVAVLYTSQVPGAKVCVEDLANIEFDFNDDCITNLKDFAMFATNWLECYIVPTCIN